MNNRKLQALRNLAERPGTEAEGIVARDMLRRFESRHGGEYSDEEKSAWKLYQDLELGILSTEQFIAGLRKHMEAERARVPTRWTCACGLWWPVGLKCKDSFRHLEIQTEIRARFQKGDRVFYNYWAYPKNCPATVTWYVKLKPENGTHPWAWIIVKFDHLKSKREIPIRSAKGWHLSHEQIPMDEANRLAGP